MSFQLLQPTQRSAKQQQQPNNQSKSPHQSLTCSAKERNTRRKRIWDLLRHMPTFTIRFLRLLLFVIFLLPAFVIFAWHYMTCDRIAVHYGKNGNEKSIDAKNTFFGFCNELIAGYRGGEKNECNQDPYFSRHYLDMYGSKTPLPGGKSSNNNKNKPVVIFLTGGAWIIGYRMGGTLLARALTAFGILVIVPDYRNFPRVNIEGMVQDVDMSIQWVFDHIEDYGGDREKVVLVGQSAGAHIGGVVVGLKVWDWLRRERKDLSNELSVETSETTTTESMPVLKSTYSPQQLCGFISTSSPHNLVTMRPVFHHHGLSASVQKSIFGGLSDDVYNNNTIDGGEDVFEKWSPYHIVMKAHDEYVNRMNMGDEKNREGPELSDIFPRFCVVHGTADKTVPVSEALEFISLLSKLNIPTDIKMYKGWTHTDPILEAPMCGNHRYHRDVYDMVCAWTCNDSKSCPRIESFFYEGHPKLKPICPPMIVKAARFCNPF